MKIANELHKLSMELEALEKQADTFTIKKEDLPSYRLGPEAVTTRRPGGPMHTRTKDVAKGQSRKDKHKKDWKNQD